MNIYVPGKGLLGAKIAIVGEAPSFEEEAALTPFVGTDGRELTRLCQEAGINRNNCWITNVSKYMVISASKEKPIPFLTRCEMSGVNIDQQIAELRNELTSIRPNIIIAMGATALWALTGKKSITNWRGSILPSFEGIKLISTFHPGTLRQGEGEYWQRPIMVLDLIRALQQSYFPTIDLPYRNLQICKSSYQLYDYLQRYRNFPRPSVDIEARRCIPACISLAHTESEGICVPLWNDMGFEEISDISDDELVSIWILLATYLFGQEVVGQNFNYDRDKIGRLGFSVRKIISDTMMKAFCINPELPKNLAFNTSIYTLEPYYKDEGMYEGSIHDLFIGGARDACVTKEIDNKMEPELDIIGQRKFFYNFLMKLPEFYAGIENIGFRIDNSIREQLLAKYIKMSEQYRYDIWRLTGVDVNTGSPKQVATLLYKGIGIPEHKGTGEEVLTQIINAQKTTDNQKKVCTLILEDRQAKKTISDYILCLPDFDGRIKTTFFPCLETGRSSTGQQDAPIRPTFVVKGRSGKTKKQSLGLSMQTLTKHGDIGADVRSAFIPDEGEVFIQADSEQAEARVTSLLADDEKMLEMYNEHDIHALTASWFFGGSENDYSKKVLGYESPQRFIGKTLRHAGERGAKKRRAASEVNTNARKYKVPITITEAQANVALATFHRMCPGIERVYFASVINCLQKDRTLIAPVPYGVDSDVGGRRTFFERWGDELNRQAFSYLPQRAVTDNTKASGIRIKERIPGIKILLESHDALLFSIPISMVNNYTPIIKEEFERPISFKNCSISRHDLVIPCSIEIGYNYKDFKKFKFEVE